MKSNLLFSIVLEAVKMSPFSYYKFDITISPHPLLLFMQQKFSHNLSSVFLKWKSNQYFLPKKKIMLTFSYYD